MNPKGTSYGTILDEESLSSQEYKLPSNLPHPPPNTPVEDAERMDILKGLQRKPIEGYEAPKNLIPSNNKGGIYSKYVNGNEKSAPYKSVGKREISNYGFNKAYAIKSCMGCDLPLDQCRCTIKSSRVNAGDPSRPRF